VVNREMTDVIYTIRGTQFIEGVNLARLTSGQAFTNSGVAAPGVDYYVFTVSAGAPWVTFDVLRPSANVDLVVRRGLPLPTATDFDYRSANPGAHDEEVLVATNSTPVALAPGDWYLGVVRGGVISYAVRATEFTSAPLVITALGNAQALADSVGAGATAYYRFPVSTGAVQANFEVFNLSADVDLLLKPYLPLPGAANFAYAGTNAGTSDEFIAVTVNSGPVPLAPGEWYLAVTNRGASAATFTVRATEFVPGTPLLARLTSGVASTNAIPAGAGVDYFVFNVPPGAQWATFDVLQPGADVDLVVRRSLPLPTRTAFDYRSANPGLADEGILVTAGSSPVPLASGDWYLGVARPGGTAPGASYAVRATAFTSAPPVIVTLTNAVAYSNFFAGAGGVHYYRFSVGSNALQANFEVLAPSGDVDLFLKRALPLPGTNLFAYESANDGTTSEFIGVATNSTPVPLSPGEWFLAVVNREPNAVLYHVRATEIVPDTPTLVRLTNGVGFAKSAAGVAGTDYYVFSVSSNAVRAQFEVIGPSADVTLVARQGLPLPSAALFDYRSANAGTNSELIALFDTSTPVALTPGEWYLGVVPAGASAASYTVRASEYSERGTNLYINSITVASNALCLTWTNALPGVTYYVQGATAVDTPLWFAVSPPVTAPGTEAGYCVPLPTAYRFFRIAELFSPGGGGGVQAGQLSIASGTNAFVIQWTAPAGAQFGVQWTVTLPNGPWNSFTNVVTSTNGTFIFVDDGSQTGGFGPRRFYRVNTLP
jgi:hypothetical protein